jgi:hypothetical protein
MATRAAIGIGVMRVVMRVGITPLTAIIHSVMRVMRHAQSNGLNPADRLCVESPAVFGVGLAVRKPEGALPQQELWAASSF